ncbi:MAG TPA: TetR/AcrR family transcriptional regulator [Virgibacillus sp.]|nr:TetR/AcrR family transcriptional regulator [Virgibacillus sp.]
MKRWQEKIKPNRTYKTTDRLLLKQGYGGFNFSALSAMLGVSRSTLYEYYASKDELIGDYMHELMKDYTTKLSTIATRENAKNQLI